jgi:hypothetical protein
MLCRPTLDPLQAQNIRAGARAGMHQNNAKEAEKTRAQPDSGQAATDRRGPVRRTDHGTSLSCARKKTRVKIVRLVTNPLARTNARRSYLSNLSIPCPDPGPCRPRDTTEHAPFTSFHSSLARLHARCDSGQSWTDGSSPAVSTRLVFVRAPTGLVVVHRSMVCT